MPLYEYQCSACGRVLEALQKFDDPPLRDCPDCDGRLKRLLSAPAFQFKGSGWYVTDYAGKKRRGADKPAAQGEKESSGSGDAKQESSGKPAAEGSTA